MRRRYVWSDLIRGHKATDVSVYKEDTGFIKVELNNEVFLECTLLQAKLIFASMSRFFGKKESKKLINVKRGKSERWS